MFYIILFLSVSIIYSQPGTRLVTATTSPSWQVQPGSSSTYRLTKFNNREVSKVNQLQSNITLTNGTQIPVSFSNGSTITITITSVEIDNPPSGTILINNESYFNVWLSIPPLTFVIPTTNDTTYWTKMGYKILGENASRIYIYTPAELMYNREFRKFNYISGWIEQENFTHYKNTYLYYQYDLIRLSYSPAPVTTTNFRWFSGGIFLLISITLIILRRKNRLK
ncbi:hypothetical protein CEE45_12430 [Candidatus Heimdallarchaeota archaeon B3_Heim]|nr:MAG: hypothetical protein CEE45_12430 [Candidatus Heimdallarchaeota archaeon B3_Heim]